MKGMGNETKGNHIEDEKPSTQVGPRSDKACLGGHDDGASECQKLIDRGCENGAVGVVNMTRFPRLIRVNGVFCEAESV